MWWVLSKQILREIMGIKTIEFIWNGAHFFSRRVILARALTKHDGLSKVRNSIWFLQECQKYMFWGCRYDSQSRKQNRWRKYGPVWARCNFRIVERHTMHDNSRKFLEMRYSFFRNIWKLNVFDAAGPLETCALRASDRTSFSAAAPENSPFWIDSAARASNTWLLLTNVAESGRGGTPKSYV